MPSQLVFLCSSEEHPRKKMACHILLSVFILGCCCSCLGSREEEEEEVEKKNLGCHIDNIPLGKVEAGGPECDRLIEWTEFYRDDIRDTCEFPLGCARDMALYYMDKRDAEKLVQTVCLIGAFTVTSALWTSNRCILARLSYQQCLKTDLTREKCFIKSINVAD